MSTGKELVRVRSQKMVAGVCAGLGRYAGLDANLVRLLFVIGTFMSGFFIGVAVYVVAIFLMKESE